MDVRQNEGASERKLVEIGAVRPSLTMSSREIADLLGPETRHDNVKRTIETLENRGAISHPQSEDRPFIDAQGKQRTEKVYLVGKRDSYVIVAQLSPEFTARLVDRWQELEEQVAKPQLPNFADPVAAARAWADEREARQVAERTKAEIGARREATAMNTASQAVKKIKRLEIELDQSAGWASVKRMEKVYRGRKFDWRALKRASAEVGISARDIPDPNFDKVKAYHAAAWEKAYGLEIPTSHGGEV